MFSTGSLQNLCLFKVVQQLEYYPPELLACLPPTLRRLLLVHLPVIDVCKLTNTCVFDGIDPETIWEQLYNQNIPRYFFATDEIFPLCDINKLSIEKAHTSFRERFLAVLANIVLNRGRPTGYFSAIKNEYSSIYGRICFTNPPPPSVLSIAPVDIVNTLIAGEKITTVEVLEAEDEEDDSNSDSDEECVFSLAEDGDFNITAVTDYYDSDKYALHRNHCALTDDRDWGHDHNEPTQYFLDYHCAYKDTNERCLSTPHRYSHHKNDYRLLDEDAITLLMRECKYYPKYLSLSVLAFNSKVWAPNLLSQFLCHLVTLEFVFSGQFVCNTEDGAPREQLLMAILSNASPSLSSLEFTSDTYNEYCLSYDEDEFEAAYVTDNHLALLIQLSELSPPTLPSLVSPLCMLRELSLSGVFTDEGLTNLGIFISRQKTLASLCLESLNVKLHTNTQNVRLIEGCVCSRKFVDALICLFQSPYFENVSLKCVKVDHAMLQDLVVGFLTSSCTHPQKLVLESIEIECETKVSGNSECQLCVPDSASQYKSFEFSVKEPETFYKSQDDATYILQWFTWFFSLKPLKLFSLKYYCWKYHVHVDCVPLVVQNTSFHVKNLSFCQCGSIFVEEIQNLLRNDTLKSLELKFCSGMIAIEHIAEHILKPVSRSSLEELKITEDIRTDRISYTQPFSQESMSLFSDTLFSLPRLNQLTLEICVLRYNQLYRNIREFTEILHESWKKNGGQKLKRFVLYAPKDQRYILDGYKLKDQEAALQMAHEIGLHLKNETDATTC